MHHFNILHFAQHRHYSFVFFYTSTLSLLSLIYLRAVRAATYSLFFCVLYSVCRVYDYEREKVLKERQNLRSAAQGTGDRSDKIRTYNFPQDRVTDHRAGKTVTGVERVMNGTDGLDSILDALEKVDRQSKIEAFLDELK